MADAFGLQVPQTLEGWYVLHDVYAVDWAAWRTLEAEQRDEIVVEASRWLTGASARDKGDSALYSVVTQKGDLMLLHYRDTPEELR